jgi:hypothetical protein
MDGMDPEGEALHRMRERATSRGERSLRSTSNHLDGMDTMDGMDPEGEALQRAAEGGREIRFAHRSSCQERPSRAMSRREDSGPQLPGA